MRCLVTHARNAGKDTLGHEAFTKLVLESVKSSAYILKSAANAGDVSHACCNARTLQVTIHGESLA